MTVINDSLFCDIERVQDSIAENDAETIEEAVKFLTDKKYK